MNLEKGGCPFLSKVLVFFLVIQGILLFQMSRSDTPGFNKTPLEKAAALLSFFGPAPARGDPRETARNLKFQCENEQFFARSRANLQ